MWLRAKVLHLIHCTEGKNKLEAQASVLLTGVKTELILIKGVGNPDPREKNRHRPKKLK